MKRGEIINMPDYFNRYINLLPDVELLEALYQTGQPLFDTEASKLIALKDMVYAPNKWTVKDIIQHLIDCERVFAYRALRFAREDKTPLPGFEENDYAKSAHSLTKSLDELLQELYILRESSILMFKGFSNEQLMREGPSNNNTTQVLAFGFTIAGHGLHHLTIIKERYYPLI